MKCIDCANKKYCPTYMEEAALYGCSSGEPAYLPSRIAKGLAASVKRASERLEIDKAKYFEEIIEEARKLI